MAAPFRVEIAPDASPFERVIARRIRSAAGDERHETLTSLETVVEVVSGTDPQRASIVFQRGHATVSRPRMGADVLSVVTDGITLAAFETDEPSEEFGRVISVLLPPPLTWQAAARTFWEKAYGRSGLPASLRVVCLDDGSELQFGAVGDPEYEIHGSGEALVALLDGRTPFLELLVTRQVFFRGSMRHLSVLQGVILDVMLDA